VLPDGRTFGGTRDLKKLLRTDEQPVAANLMKHLTVYATGAPVRFSDRAVLEQMTRAAKADGYGLRGRVQQVVQSDLLQDK
jgi:hypothetical protein